MTTTTSTDLTYIIEDAATRRMLQYFRERQQMVFIVQEAYGKQHVIVARSVSECDEEMANLGIDLARDRYARYRQGPDGSVLISGNDDGVVAELKKHLQESLGIVC